MRTSNMVRAWAARGVAIGLMLIGGLAAAAAPASAGPVEPMEVTQCQPYSSDVWFTSTNMQRKVTHTLYVQVPSGGETTVGKSVTKTATITASVKFSSSVTVSGGIVIGELSGTVGVELAASGSYTKQSSEWVSKKVTQGTYAFWAGEKKFSGSYKGWKCNSRGTGKSSIYGTATSWAVHGEGAARCGTTYSSGSWERSAVNIAC